MNIEIKCYYGNLKAFNMCVYGLSLQLNKIETSLKDLYELADIKVEDESNQKIVRIIGIFTDKGING